MCDFRWSSHFLWPCSYFQSSFLFSFSDQLDEIHRTLGELAGWIQTRFGAWVIFLNHFTFNPILMWIYSRFVVGCYIKEHQKREEAHQSHTLSLCVSFYYCLLFFTISLFQTHTHTHWAKHTLYRSGACDLSCRVSSMAHFHKSHVSVFVARGTLTRGHSPNTERIKTLKTLPTHSTDRFYGHIHQRGEEVGKFHVETARKCFVIWRALMKESACVFEVCLCPPLSQVGPHAEAEGGPAGSARICTSVCLLTLQCTHTRTQACTQVLWGKSSHTLRVRVRAAVVVSMETAT